ncbi:hypothetical protein Efla_006018 [Eimeria flavescens]
MLRRHLCVSEARALLNNSYYFLPVADQACNCGKSVFTAFARQCRRRPRNCQRGGLKVQLRNSQALGATRAFNCAGPHSLISRQDGEKVPEDSLTETRKMGAPLTIESLFQAFSALSAAQEAAVLRLRGPPAADATLSQTWRVLAEVRRLHEMRRQVINRAKRLHRCEAALRLASNKSFTRGSGSALARIGVLDDAACYLPVTVALALRAAADRLSIQVDALPSRQLLLLCENLAKVDCCLPSLMTALLERLIAQASCLQAYDVALGLQVIVLLLRQSEHRHAPASPAASAEELYKISQQKHEGQEHEDLYISEAGTAAASVGPDLQLQQLCLVAATRLLEVLTSNADVRRSLSVRMAVRTAEACTRLAKHSWVQSKPPNLSANFAAAVVGGPSTGVPPRSREHSIRATSRGCLESSNGSFAKIAGEKRPSLADSISSSAEMATCEPAAAGIVQRAHAPKTVTVSNVDSAGQVLRAALALRIRQSLAPRAASLLLKEACAVQQHQEGRSTQCALHWTLDSVGAAMAAATSGGLTQATSARLLRQLFQRLRRSQLRKMHHQPVRFRQLEALATDEDQRALVAKGDKLGFGPHAATLGLTPVILASICHSLATSGFKLEKTQLSFLLSLIQASFKEDIGKEILPISDIKELPSDHPDGHIRGEDCTVSRSVSPNMRWGIGSSRASPETSSQTSPPSYPCKVAAFYKEWCLVLWACAKLLKSAASYCPQENYAILKVQEWLIEDMLAKLVELLPVADPHDVGQIAAGLRLLLLVSIKRQANIKPSDPLFSNSQSPLVLRQSCYPVSKLLFVLQSIGKHLMQHSEDFGLLELLECLRLFVHLDLLHYLDIEWEAEPCREARDAQAHRQSEKRSFASRAQSDILDSSTTVCATSILHCSLTRLVSLMKPEHPREVMHRRTSFGTQRQSQEHVVIQRQVVIEFACKGLTLTVLLCQAQFKSAAGLSAACDAARCL